MRIKWFSGIRLTGLVLVLLYHFFKVKFPGGFIGVDIFFTCSGYLVTALFIDEYFRDEAIDLKRFAKRRLYRIVPPLVLMVLLVMPLTLLIKRDFLADIGHQLVSVLGFTTNIYEQMTGGNYEAQFIPHLFLHTWSLAIEVQFYLVWGLAFFVLSRRGLTANQFRSSVFLLSGGLFILSFLSLFIRAFFTENFSFLYFSSFLRSSSLFLGSLLATLAGIANPTNRFKRNLKSWPLSRILGTMALCLLLLASLSVLLNFNHITTYLFGFSLASLLTVVLIYNARLLHDKLPDLAEPGWLTFLADISYGLYLFHWPLYLIFSQFLPQLVAVILTLLFSTVLATLSFQVVEPILAGRSGNLLGLDIQLPENKRPLAIVLGLLTTISLVLTLTAPKVGAFETNLLVSSLRQANQQLNRSHTLLAGDANALSNITIIGDSVTLNAMDSLEEALPDAVVDAAISRSFTLAFDVFQNQIKSSTLGSTVVLAVGVNSVYNYEGDIDRFIKALPDGHRLVIVTPYNTKDGRIPDMRTYELSLAETYPYIAVADWYQTAVDHPEIWSGSDGVHFEVDTGGAELYAQTIKEAVVAVSKQTAKGD